MITADDIANELGVSPRTIRRHCHRLGIPKIGSQYVLTIEQYRDVRASVRGKVGNPLMSDSGWQREQRQKATGAK